MTSAFDEACALLGELLDGDARRDIVAGMSTANDLRTALLRLRDSMRSHSWRAGAQSAALGRFVKTFDSQTRDEGFHVLHDWDGKADHVNDEIIPIDVLHYVAGQRGGDPPDALALAILLDYYCLHLLQLLSIRIWDAGDADANLDRLQSLVDALQGEHGSGQRFVNDAETLMLIASSHFELHERGYETLLARARTLNRSHRLRIAMGHAASMGSHLRFGFEATYARDTIVMRDDNAADYPWLCFALVTLAREYAAGGAAREPIAEAMLNGLTADARAFVGEPPPALSRCEAERAEFRTLFLDHREALTAEFEQHRPTSGAYSPLSFFFNFSHNVLKGTIVDALLRSTTWDVTFNDLLTGLPRGAPIAAEKARLAGTLMGYARANPDTIRGRPMPVIVYDPSAGHQAFTIALRKLKADG